jgi:DNA-binding response OmpR family regulator
MNTDEFNVDQESVCLGSQPTERTIMWVEDDLLLSDMISRKCSINKCTLLHAVDADQAMNILKDTIPDVIILDILLPGKNGFEILEEIKSREDTKNIPVVILSNFGQKEEIEKGLRLGAEKYLVKATLTLDEILVQVNQVLDKHINDSQS